jgi:hypothetical protein
MLVTNRKSESHNHCVTNNKNLFADRYQHRLDLLLDLFRHTPDNVQIEGFYIHEIIMYIVGEAERRFRICRPLATVTVHGREFGHWLFETGERRLVAVDVNLPAACG